MTKKCSECGWCILNDYGYSNYTVEGTEVICFKNLNPNGDFDHWYGEDKRDLYAEECSKYVSAEPVRLDTDLEDVRDRYGDSDWSEYSNGYISAEDLKKWEEG